ncbi:MAG: zinc-dependent alcohol dehydrogenase family protein [Puniceicoccales bacterium]|jgi:NADPH:quinone reductase-like Zn-dependent oxidoreductase|nr:zinc-dependent alcohol dehydrogenase family protein [Puniceicoccales bacterium]
MSSAFPTTSHAVRYHETGKPNEVLKYEELPLPVPGADEVLILMEMAVIHPSDLGMIGGTYGRLRDLPAVAGREAIGRIAKVGSAVTTLQVGDRVKMPEDAGVWRESVVAKASGLMPVPSDIPAEQACMAFINPPTAWLLLREFANLKSGDWVIQNASNSAVGECVVQLAKSLGLHTVCLVRSPEKHAANLKAMGADIVLADDDKATKALAAQWQGAAAQLALNSIGGPSAITLTRALDNGGTLVTFGGMTGDMIRFPTREFIFKDIRYRGFWMDRWARSAQPKDLEGVFDAIFSRLRDGSLKMAVDSVYPLADYASALAKAGGYSRNGKVLLRGPASA